MHKTAAENSKETRCTSDIAEWSATVVAVPQVVLATGWVLAPPQEEEKEEGFMEREELVKSATGLTSHLKELGQLGHHYSK